MMEHLSLVPYEGGGGAAGGGAKYKECMRNHAAAMGGQAFDGCGEFMPDTAGPDSLKCAACGCHRSFHRRAAGAGVPGVFFRPPPPPTPSQHHHPHHHVAALQAFLPSTPAAAAPPPPPHLALPYHAVPAAPWSVMRAGSETPPRPGEEFGVLLPGIGGGGGGTGNGSSGGGGMARKRFRTKFTPEQKERMQEFAEKQGWRINRNDDGALERFCHEIGVRRQVLKVWMHNHKNNHTTSTQQKNHLVDGSSTVPVPNTSAAAAAMGVPGAVTAPGMIDPGATGTGTGIPPGVGGGADDDDDDDDDDTDDSPPRAAVSSPSPSPISV